MDRKTEKHSGRLCTQHNARENADLTHSRPNGVYHGHGSAQECREKEERHEEGAHLIGPPGFPGSLTVDHQASLWK